MSAPVVEVSHLSKRFSRDLRRSLRYGLADIGRELVPRSRPRSPRPGEFAALDDVSFELHRGEALAVVGANGAGKSTLLKILHGLLKPDAGEVRVRGRVGALIELGTGFDPILTGRENIALNAAALGFDPRRLDRAVDEIVAFAELEDAIDSPVRYYSSGMTARLAFATAAHLDPDVLLVDEVLAVGDFAFQRRCVGHIRAFLERGGALILVSHNAFLVQSTCRRGLLLEAGRVTFTGDAVETTTHLLASLTSHAGEDGRPRRADPDASRPLVIDESRLVRPDGGPLQTGAPAEVRVTCRSAVPIDVLWGFGIWTGDGWTCVTGDMTLSPRRIDRAGELTCRIPRLPLLPGVYGLRTFVSEAATEQALDVRGFEDEAPVRLLVEAAPDRVTNTHTALGQLVTLDVEFD